MQLNKKRNIIYLYALYTPASDASVLHRDKPRGVYNSYLLGHTIHLYKYTFDGLILLRVWCSPKSLNIKNTVILLSMYRMTSESREPEADNVLAWEGEQKFLNSEYYY